MTEDLFDVRHVIVFVLYWAIIAWQLGIDRRGRRTERRVAWLEKQLEAHDEGPYREMKERR